MAKEINFFMQDVETASSNQLSQSMQPRDFLSPVDSKNRDERDEEQNNYKTDKELFFRQKAKAKRVIEALLFATNEPLTFTKIREIVDTIYEFKPRTLREMIDELQNDFISKQMVYRLEEIAEGFLLRTSEEFGPYLNLLYRNKRVEKLSQAATEVLSIIAYRQPITRPQIDSIRGVDSSGVIMALLERQLIEPLGKLEAPGRPMLFGITKDFLKYFGLKDLSELPKIDLKPS